MATTGKLYPISGLPIYFCGSATLEVLRYVLNGTTLGTESLGTYTLGATPGTETHAFTSGGYSAMLAWQVTAVSAARFFDGRLDDVRLWPRDLSGLEVRALAAGGYRAASLAEAGAGMEQTQWSAQRAREPRRRIPAGPARRG